MTNVITPVVAAGNYPRKHTKRENKVIETVNEGAGKLKNKTLESSCKMVDATDNTKTVAFNLSGATANADLTIVSSQTADRTLTIPVLGGADTVATLATANVFTADQSAPNVIVTNQGALKLREATGGGTNVCSLSAPAALAADVAWVLPSAQGSASEVLTNNGAGTLSWAAQSFLQSTASSTVLTGAILAANAAPVELVAAPGAGKVLIVDELELFLDFASAAYVRNGGNEELVIQYSGGVDIHAFANATDTFLTAGADAHRVITPTIYNSAVANFDPMSADNESIVLYITNSEVITGDSPIKYRVKYRTVTLLT